MNKTETNRKGVSTEEFHKRIADEAKRSGGFYKASARKAAHVNDWLDAYVKLEAELEHVRQERDNARFAFSKLAQAHDSVLQACDELLALIKRAESWGQYDLELLQDMRAAIAKAERSQ